MENKPKIYANCKAGCLWETVHKDDFQRSAAFIRQNVTDNGVFKEFNLEAGQTCILNGDIFAADEKYFKVQVEIRDVLNNVYKGPITVLRSRYDTSLRIKNCGTYQEADGTYTLYYELREIVYDAGTQKFNVSNYHTITNLPMSQIVMRLMYVDEVYLVNDGMEAILNAEEESV